MRERILMHVNSLSETGTSTSVFEYALGLMAREFQVSVAYNSNAHDNHPLVISNFKKSFDLIPYTDFKSLDLLASRKFDVGYFLKAGTIDGHVFSRIPSSIHAVFKHFEPHGDAYCYISEWLCKEMENYRKSITPVERFRLLLKGSYLSGRKSLEYVPHCVDLPKPTESLRSTWGIPESAILGIRIGGYEKFDIEWVHDSVKKVLNTCPDLFFVFVNTKKFIDHPRVKFESAIIDIQKKVNALHSSDFFLHARKMGESFGMAILEAMRCEIPVFAWEGGRDKNHTLLLSEKSLYQNSADLCEKIINVAKYDEVELNYLKSLEFTRDRVLDKFEYHFIRYPLS